MFMLNGSPLPIDTPFEVDGTHFPANWLRLTTMAEKLAIGITEVPDPEPYDDRFYWGVGNPKQLEDVTETPEGQTEEVTSKGLKSQWIAQVKDTAGKLLAQTDWMVIRKAERDVAIPAEVVAKRAAIVAECARLETAIAGCADVPALIEVVSSQNWGMNEI
jgi:hypothetical protein